MSARNLPVAYSDDAQDDLSSILMYTDSEWGESQRASYEQTLRDAVDILSRTPMLGRVRGDLSAGLRSYPVGSHIVYYWVLHDTLYIIRILHNRQDPSRETWEQPPAPE